MTALAKIEKFQTAAHFDENQIELIKNSICKGATNDELQFFLMACQKTGLDPFSRQIYSVARGGQRTIQTSIDGFRLIADRSGKYAPGKEPMFTYDKNGNLESATAYVMKQTKDGTWHEVSANAHFNEYNAGSMIWKKMPRCMLSKCAESLALRKAFPAEMSGLYGEEEMNQADKQDNVKPLYIQKNETISMQQAIELNQLLAGCSEKSKKGFNDVMANNLRIDGLEYLPLDKYENIKSRLTASYKEYQNELLEKEMAITGEVEVLE